MNKKIPLGISITLIITSITATFAITMSIAKGIYSQMITDLTQRSQQYEAIEDVAIKSRDFYWRTDINDLTHLSSTVKGYIDGLDDPYGCYMDAEAYAEYMKRMQGQMQGIGAVTALNPQTGRMQITEVFANSPAEKSGLKRGDVVLKIEDEAVTAANYDDMAEKLKGRRLTSVRITYGRGDQEITEKVMLGYNHQSVTSKLIGDIGYIKITAFYQNAVPDFKKAVDSLVKQQARALIFDLRNTTEGDIRYAAEIIAYLVPLPTEGSKAIATLVRPDGSILETYTSDPNSVAQPMAVLVNGRTVGLAELFACDLRDYGKASLVGEQTRGNGSYQKLYRLKEGGAMLLTVAMIKPYISEGYHETGLTPDVLAELTPEQEKNFELLSPEQDPQLQLALTLFAER